MTGVADRIHSRRETLDISVNKLATEAAIPRITLTRRLADPSTFTLAELDRIATVLGMDSLELLTGTVPA